jgi:hypothetical protein
MRQCLYFAVAILCFAAALPAQHRVDPRYGFEKASSITRPSSLLSSLFARIFRFRTSGWWSNEQTTLRHTLPPTRRSLLFGQNNGNLDSAGCG